MTPLELADHLRKYEGREIVISCELPDGETNAAALLVTDVVIKNNKVYVMGDEGMGLWVTDKNLEIEDYRTA